MNWLLIVFVALAGAMLPLQALVNGRLGQATGSGVFASTVSFVIGTVALLLVTVAMRPALPSLAQAMSFPAWIWLGGLLGAAFVVIATIAAPRLGAAALISVVVLGQMISSIALDHYGVLHAAQPVNLSRVAGCLLVVVGALLVVQPWKAT